MIKVNYKSGENILANSQGPQLRGAPKADNLEGLNPRELLEASLGLCMSLVITGILRRDGLLKDDSEIRVEVDGRKDSTGANRFEHFDIDIQLPQGLEDAYVKKLLLLAKRGCTISNTLAQASSFELRVRD